MNRTWAVPALVLAPVLMASSCLGGVLLIPEPPPTPVSCRPAGATTAIDLASLPSGEVAGYSGQQLANAAAIVNAAVVLGLDHQAQVIGVMTAMGESSLRVLDRGDAVGPDSRGLFQQRGNGAWGSYSDRMDPTTAATNFYRALVKVPGWNTLAPTIAAHRTQRNADPYHYERFWEDATDIVDALAQPSATSPAAVPAAVAASSGGGCMVAAVAGTTTDGWTRPAVGPITSGFGPRRSPTAGASSNHAGTDLGAPCQAPIYAAAGGRVVGAGAASGYGNLITIDHGGGVVTRYAHMWNDAILTQVGATVTAGEQIAQVGNAGVGTGCHLHFEVRLSEQFTDPVPFMAQRGVPLS